MKNQNIAFHLSFYLLLAGFTLTMLIVAIGYRFTRDTILDGLADRAQTVTHTASLLVNDAVVHARKSAEIIESGTKQMNSAQEMEDLLQLVLKSNPHLEAVQLKENLNSSEEVDHFFYRKDSTIIGSDSDLPMCTQLQDWYHQVFVSGKAGWSDPFWVEGHKTQCIAYAIPFHVKKNGKEVPAIACSVMSLEDVYNELSGIQIYKSGFPILFSSKGKVVYHPQPAFLNENVDTLSHCFSLGDLSKIKRIISRGVGGRTLLNPACYGGRRATAVYWPVTENGWLMMVLVPYSELLGELRKVIILVMFLVLIGTGVMVSVTILLSRSVTTPITQLADEARRIMEEEGEPLEVVGNEFEVLAGGLAHMKQRMENYHARWVQSRRDQEELDRELDLARSIEMSIVPSRFPIFPDRKEFDCFGKLIPARSVGGDLFDVFFLDEDKLCISICDTLGKGIPAAMFSVMTRTLMRGIATANIQVGSIMERLNEELCSDAESDMFVTVFLSVLEISTGTFTYCNAGHPHPYLLRRDGAVEELQHSHGIPVGVMPRQTFDETKMVFKPGEMLITYTDGVTEEQNESGKMFGQDRLRYEIAQVGQVEPEAMVERILDSLLNFRGRLEQRDDTTLFAVKYFGNIGQDE
ncbi:SpoIIE family protein phosphatase [Prolixibacter sp. NT017]|uniref:SpoIIE family protein phosphatase n=1 Tax=Prolixibacter sp. NT017 TaxID=2652390 RepID=UPI001283DD29|nr:SpoIIE family protein phosphatase [Prolixibacter sp. NT017]GET25110.1 hypothetical protein NT017_14390 [Prolixibacter sp. NT017]